jgi:hypothetical protein
MLILTDKENIENHLSEIFNNELEARTLRKEDE